MGRPAVIEPIPIPLDDNELVARIFRGLGDTTRVQILRMLLDGPLSQKEIVAEVGISQGRVSQHLACLVWCGFVESDKDGRGIEYRITNVRVASLLDVGTGFLDSTAGEILCCRVTQDGSLRGNTS